MAEWERLFAWSRAVPPHTQRRRGVPEPSVPFQCVLKCLEGSVVTQVRSCKAKSRKHIALQRLCRTVLGWLEIPSCLWAWEGAGITGMNAVCPCSLLCAVPSSHLMSVRRAEQSSDFCYIYFLLGS